MAAAPERIMEENIECEIVNVRTETDVSLTDNRIKMGIQAGGPMVFLYQQGSSDLAQAPLPNPGEGSQLTSDEGENSTIRGVKRCRLSDEETREKNRLKAKVNREKMKEKMMTLEKQVNTLISKNKDKDNEIEDLRRKNDDLQQENTDLKRKMEGMETTPPQITSNADLSYQLAYEKGKSAGIMMMVPLLKQVIVVRETPSANSASVTPVEILDTGAEMAPTISVPENSVGGPTSQPVPNDGTNQFSVDDIFQMLQENVENQKQ